LPDERLMGALRTLAAVASAAAPLILVFDQLENLIDASDSDGRVRAYASLIAELVDTVPGLVIVQMAVDNDWARDIEPRVGQAQKSRLLGTRHFLQLPSASQRQELLERWVERLPEREAAFPWPFKATEVENWKSLPGMTPRMLLLGAERALAEYQETSDPEILNEPEALDDRLQRQWQKHVETARLQIDEAAHTQRGPEPEHVVDGLLLLGLWFGRDCQRAKDGTVVFDTDGGRRHLCFLHDVHPRTIAARLRRWIDSSETRVVLREQWREFPTTWNAVQRLAEEFATQPAATFEWVNREDLTRLLALRSFVMQARSHDVVGTAGESVSAAQAMDWLRRALVPQHWPIVIAMTRPLSSNGPRKIHPRKPFASDLYEAPPTVRDSQPPATENVQQRIGTAVTGESRALRVLEHLRVASLERLIREAVFMDASVTRKQVIEELRALGPRIRWFGRAIVVLLPEDSV
jgi:hypothetical protein